jgi:magnesium transporter
MAATISVGREGAEAAGYPSGHREREHVAPMPPRALRRTGDDGWTEVNDLDEALRLRRNPGTLTWIESDVSGTSEAEIRALGSEFEIDPLAVEDAMSPRQRPKLEAYTGHLLVVVHQLDEDDDDQLVPRQVAACIGPGFLIVLHHGAGRLVREIRDRVRTLDAGRATGDRLLHAMVDTAVDDDETIANRIADEVEDMEEVGLELARRREQRPDRRLPQHRWPSQYRLYTLKQQMSTLRRYALPLGAALERRPSSEGREPDDEVEFLFRDVHDHVIRLAAAVRSSDELTDGVLGLVRSVAAESLNETNKKLTAWAAIVAAPALIVGLYGINYALVPSKSLGEWGFVVVLGLMGLTSGALYVSFRRRDWL